MNKITSYYKSLRKDSVSRQQIKRKVNEGTKFTIRKYGDVLEALAKSDKKK